jgi:hypothetical protein
MNILLSALLAAFLLFLPLANSFAQTDQEPPTAVIVAEDFSPMRHTWQPLNGVWDVNNGTYGASSAGETDISTIISYRGLHPADPPEAEIRHEEFFVRARVRNHGVNDTQHVGIVYGFQDSQNYYEALISGFGFLRLRTVVNGIAVDEFVSPGSTRCVTNVWCDLEVRWDHGTTTVTVNGEPFLDPVAQPEFTSGQIGLITHGTVGRFDKVRLAVPFGNQGFLETFDDAIDLEFAPQIGDWTVTGGSYRSGVRQTSISLAPVLAGGHPGFGDTFEYTFHARMLNPYGAAGNLVGIVFNYQGFGSNVAYTELVFSPTGVARLNRFENGAVHTIATENYGGQRNVAFEVKLENGPNRFGVFVDGQRLFQNVIIFDVNPSQFPEGHVGLITHWAPGRFDNVQFDHGFFQPCSFSFSDPLPSQWVVSGTWNTNGGTLNNTSAGRSDIVDVNCRGNFQGSVAGTNTVYSARLLNEFGASGNLVGLVYNYQSGFYAGDYLELVFSPTGTMQLNRFIQGVRYPFAVHAHNIPRNTWFDVEVIRTGIFTTVKLNGATIWQRLPQGDLSGGSIGAITHWSRGRFDNLSLREHVRPPSEL